MTEILAIILGGGAAAMVTACVAAYRSIKEGSRAQEKDAVADLEKWRASADDRRERVEVERDYWRMRSGSLEYLIVSRWGAEHLPPRESFPWEKDDVSGAES